MDSAGEHISRVFGMPVRVVVSLLLFVGLSPAFSSVSAQTLAISPVPAQSAQPSWLTSAKPAAKAGVRPEKKSTGAQPWSELTPVQRQALAPLEAEWNNIDPVRQRKWLSIGNRFSAMNPEEQQRLQDRMRDWARLTPDQRRLARENFYRTKKLDSTQKKRQMAAVSAVARRAEAQTGNRRRQEKDSDPPASAVSDENPDDSSDQNHAETGAGKIGHAAGDRAIGIEAVAAAGNA